MPKQTDKGWVLIHRKICENKFWLSESFTKGQAWVDLFLNANHTDGSFWVRGNEVKLKRGQIGWSELTMSKRWGWSKNKTRRFLKALETEQQIEQQKTFITTIITILKYADYQDMSIKRNSRRNSRKTADDTQTKNVTNVTNDKEEKNTNIVASPPDEIPLLLDFFKKTVNPHINFGNKTERKACQDLLDSYGLEKIKSALLFLEEKRKTDKYLPLITTPYELWTKWAKIKQHLIIKKRKIWTSQSPPSPQGLIIL